MNIIRMRCLKIAILLKNVTFVEKKNWARSERGASAGLRSALILQRWRRLLSVRDTVQPKPTAMAAQELTRNVSKNTTKKPQSLESKVQYSAETALE
jgi:hypothetical protein